MTKLPEQRLWVVVHLLYPNSSQALDVYYTILSLVSKKSDKNYQQKLFKKLAQFSMKTAAVRSSQPFQVFENCKLDNWNIIYKRSPKQQLLVICGLVVFKFSTFELAEILHIPEQKIKYLVNQSFKKTSQISIVKPVVKTDFSFKKKSENQISYLYTNENLVEYGLGLLAPPEKAKVEQGLTLYKQLVPLHSYYKEIIDEIQNLINPESNSYYLQAQETNKEIHHEPQTVTFDFLKIKRKFIVLSAVSAIFILLVTVRPAWLQHMSFKSTNNSIVVQEIQNPGRVSLADTAKRTDGDAINLHEMPVAKNETQDNQKPQVVAANSTEVKNELFANKPKDQSESLAKPTTKPAMHNEASGKKVSGLYRASIVVTDLDSTSNRITEKLVALGGKKAGEVELGWKKNSSLAYYHLTIPEENLEAAKTFISNFGKLNIQFENHPRLLPAGTNRIILEVKESE